MKSNIYRTITIALLATTTALAHSDSLKPGFVDMLLKPYFELQASLASDDLGQAKKHATTFDTMLGHGPSHEEAPTLATLRVDARKVVNATDIKIAREAFHAISNEIISLVEHVGTGGDTVFKMHCPMAFSNKGGSWLQANKDLRNPYYGSMMLHCGMKQAELGKAK